MFTPLQDIVKEWDQRANEDQRMDGVKGPKSCCMCHIRDQGKRLQHQSVHFYLEIVKNFKTATILPAS